MAAAAAATLPRRGHSLAGVAGHHRAAGGAAPTVATGHHGAGSGAAPAAAAAIDSSTSSAPNHRSAPAPGAVPVIAIANSRVGSRIIFGSDLYPGTGTPGALSAVRAVLQLGALRPGVSRPGIREATDIRGSRTRRADISSVR